ncbi:hypothetical protein FRC03_007439 [Tulasnella sp. 419]|nr:hypothetical protein FRC03_007439 [Tulasnella sp. 419]
MVVPYQRWVDGVVTGDNEVRQFVATPLHSGNTIESQITGRDALGGLQIEFIPSYDTEFTVMSPGAGPLDTPASLGLQRGTKVQLRKYSVTKYTIQDYTVADYQEYFNSHGDVLRLQVAFSGIVKVKDLRGTYQLKIESLGDPVWMIKEMIEQYTDIPVHQQRLMYYRKLLEDDKTLPDYNIDYGDTIHLAKRLRGGALSWTGPQVMGIGAAGKIQQKIYKDIFDKRIWDLGAATVTNFQLLNALDFARVTNMRPPPSPITKETYDKQGIPWFEFYDEDLRQLQDPQGPARFQNLKTLNLSPEVMLRDILVLALGKDLSDRSNLPCAQYVNKEKGLCVLKTLSKRL